MNWAQRAQIKAKRSRACGGLSDRCQVVWGFVPGQVPVEIATVRRGPLQVTSDEDAETRAHDRYAVSAPVAGRISRVELHEGDAVRAG